MAKLSQLNQDIIFRLILAKKLFQKGIDACKTDTDIYGFSHGVITLHDALDNFTATIANHLGLISDDKNKFLSNYLDLITNYEKQNDVGFVLKNRNHIDRINTLRNNIKHKGITPNIQQEKTIINPIIDFFNETLLKYFSIDWDLISLVELIKDGEIKKELLEVENLIEQLSYKEALEKMAIIKFKVFDEFTLKSRTTAVYGKFLKNDRDIEKWSKSSNIFLSQVKTWDFHSYDRVDFLEKGISHKLMDQFSDFTPKVGINNTTEWKYIFDHGLSWSEENWTKDICLFCYNFLIDAIIKNQYPSHAVRLKDVRFYYKIKAIEDIPIYDKDNNLIYTFQKGNEKIAMIFSRVLNEWEIFNDADKLISFMGDTELHGEEQITGYWKGEDHLKIDFVKTIKVVDGEEVA